MHQGKYRGAWKKAYFVLKQPYLFQYEKEDVRHCRARAATRIRLERLVSARASITQRVERVLCSRTCVCQRSTCMQALGLRALSAV